MTIDEGFKKLLQGMGDTDEWLRQQVLRLVRQHGVSQKVLAAKMGLSTARLSRWLNKNDQHPVSVAALDGFQAYREHLRRDLSTDDIETDVTRQPKQGRAVPSAPRHQQHPRRRTG